MAIKIDEGMSADDVLKVLGRPKAIEVVGDEGGDRLSVKELIVKWLYRSAKLTLARRLKHGVTCYRVIEVEVLNE